jgi:hypothetical protein
MKIAFFNLNFFSELVMDLYAKEKSYEEYRTTGVHRILLDIPDKTEELKMVISLKSKDYLVELS